MLANSKMLGGRCIAGIHLQTFNWIRLVDERKGGLWESRTQLDDGLFPEVMDVIEVEAEALQSNTFQPENMQIGERQWRRGTPSPPDEEILYALYKTIQHDSSYLFGFGGDYCDLEVAIRSSMPTLSLIEPKNVNWEITTGQFGKRQLRVHFSQGEERYNLPVTDPTIQTLFVTYEYGLYDEFTIQVAQQVGYEWDADAERLVFAVSLGRPYGINERCFKLVAGVTTLPFLPAVEEVEKLETADVADSLRQRGLTPVDLRKNNGCLWIQGGPELASLLEELQPDNAQFVYTLRGGKATSFEPGWYLRKN